MMRPFFLWKQRLPEVLQNQVLVRSFHGCVMAHETGCSIFPVVLQCMVVMPTNQSFHNIALTVHVIGTSPYNTKQ